jgi:hypothetical protein
MASGCDRAGGLLRWVEMAHRRIAHSVDPDEMYGETLGCLSDSIAGHESGLPDYPC